MFQHKTIALFFISCIVSITASCQGIIIADDKKQEQLFATEDTSRIIAFSKEISARYPQAIIHLGRSYVFQKGNIYDSKISSSNLNLFCKELKRNGTQVLVWFFDSYGAGSFKNLYDEHEKIIDENINMLDSLHIPYDGIAIDMEWINKNSNVSNNKNYIKLLSYLKQKIPNKKLWCFASLLNDERINSERGYDTKQILSIADNFIETLYLQDADFFVLSKYNKPEINISRIDNLRKYYKDQGWLVAVSVQSGIVVRNENENGFDLLPYLGVELKSLKANAKYKGKKRNKYAVVYEYKLKKNITLKSSDNEEVSFHRRQRIFYFKINYQKLITKKDFIWEYFILNNELNEN